MPEYEFIHSPGAFVIRLVSRITFALLFIYGIFFAFLLMKVRFFWRYFLFILLVAENFCIPYVHGVIKRNKAALPPLSKLWKGRGRKGFPL